MCKILIMVAVCFFIVGCATYKSDIISLDLSKEQRKLADPYINKMRKQIEEHWTPPQSVTKNGEVVVSFKIMPDGRTEDIKIIKSKGDEAMEKSSLQAIVDSSPFASVPPEILKNEEEKYIGITFTFYYYAKPKVTTGAKEGDVYLGILHRATNKGILVLGVIRDTSAWRANIERGDIIVEIDGKKVNSDKTLFDILQLLEIGKKYDIGVMRKDKKETISITAEEYRKK